MFAARMGRIQMSSTFRVAGLARDLKARGVDVVDFSVGEPDFNTPAPIKAAGKRAIDANMTRYTANEGTIELRKAIQGKLLEDNGLSYGLDEILVSPGAKASLFCAAMALYDEGDEVLVPAPCWVSHPEQVRLAGANPVFVHGSEENGFKVDAAQLDAAVTPKTKALVLNYPSNPTGSCYDRSELERIASVCRDRNLAIVADEIYEKLLYDGRKFTSVAAVSEDAKQRTVVVNGLSKAFAMTGWRVGYAAARRDVIAEMGKIQSHTAGHPASMAQAASVEAFRSATAEVTRMAAEFQARRDLIVKRLRTLPGWTCVEPAGAFYVFPNVSTLFGRKVKGHTLVSSTDVAMDLLERAAVAVVPGDAFEAPSHIRISFACSADRINEGMDRIAKAYA